MNRQQFDAALQLPTPPEDMPLIARALWHAAKGNWDAAHQAAQEQDDAAGAWVHAYLHRWEGDTGNAAYWYRRAGKPFCHDDRHTEWRTLVAALIPGQPGGGVAP